MKVVKFMFMEEPELSVKQVKMREIDYVLLFIIYVNVSFNYMNVLVDRLVIMINGYQQYMWGVPKIFIVSAELLFFGD